MRGRTETSILVVSIGAILASCTALQDDIDSQKAAITDPGDPGDPGDPNEEEIYDDVFDELMCVLDDDAHIDEAILNAELACKEYNFMCNLELIGLGADILGHIIPASCAAEFPVGATVAVAVGWDPNAGIIDNMLNDPKLDLICQLAECTPPTDPFTVSAKLICGCRSLDRTLRRCTELYEKCEDAKGLVPLVDGDGEIIDEANRCPIPAPGVNGCNGGQAKTRDELVIECAHTIDNIRDQIDNNGYGDCISSCVNNSLRNDCGGPPEPPADM